MLWLILIVMLAIFTGVSWYLARRLHGGLVPFFKNLRFWPFLVCFLALNILLLLGFGRSMLPFSKGVKDVFGLFSAYYMGIILYLLLFTLIVDLLLAIPKCMKLSFTARRYFKSVVTLSVLLLTAVTVIFGSVNARQLDHVTYEVQLNGKTDISDMKMVLISDLHLGAVGSEDRLEEIVEEINSLNPDVVCIAGDIFDTDFTAIHDPETAAETLKNLRTTYGVYACLGNHDGGETGEKMTDFLTHANIELLADTYTIIDGRLVLAGRLDSTPIGGYGDRQRQPLSIDEDPSLPVIVLDHNPANIEEYGAETDLVLCGHTHKGQVFPANLITKAIYTVDYGHY